jgi:Ca2+-binding EF-hand superfamily protein
MDTFSEEDLQSDKNDSQVLIEAKFEKLFTEFDQDKNGVITKNEMFDFLIGLFGVEATKIDIDQVLRKESFMVPKKAKKGGWDDSASEDPEEKNKKKEEQKKVREENIAKLLELI